MRKLARKIYRDPSIKKKCPTSYYIGCLLGYGFGDGHGFGLGFRAGFTLSSNLNIGVRSVYHFENSDVDTSLSFNETINNVFYFGVDLGYRKRVDRMILYPYLNIGYRTYKYVSFYSPPPKKYSERLNEPYWAIGIAFDFMVSSKVAIGSDLIFVPPFSGTESSFAIFLALGFHP